MSKLSDNKLIKLGSKSSQGGFWYITKQNLVFRDLCFIAKILEEWGDRQEENYQTFFDKHKELPEFGGFPPLTAHRATKNCEYIGLIIPSDKYSSQSLTPFYFSLKKLCNGDFNKLLLYPEIIDKQLERIFIDSNNKLPYTESFKICPFMFLFKILLLIGDITKLYKISTSEFKLFVATAQNWSEYFEVTESILRYRNDNNFRLECDANNNKVADVRYNILAQNHSQLEVTKNEIAIKENQITNIRRKVAEYELNDTVQSVTDMYSASSISINKSLQQIFYGAPGTGKSHKIKENEQVKNAEEKKLVFRTTFHPDSDYSTFVGAYKPTMKPVADKYKAVAGKDEEITYSFVPQAFLQSYVAAWKNPDEKVFLIIEEINRGNCAQIFGDLFQLLDRDENGVSEYKIKADADIKAHLEKELGQDSDGIKDGELCLPKNLYIWATMNTSDQSLFPIDSAFKRRWDWKYVKIKNEHKDWKVDIDIKTKDSAGNETTAKLDWYEFIDKINEIIASMTSSADKQLGYFFCKPKTKDSKEIDAETFVSKVIFYLWNDVFKDYAFEDASLFQYTIEVNGNKETKDLTFPDFYNDDESINTTCLTDFIEKVLNWKKGNEDKE